MSHSHLRPLGIYPLKMSTLLYLMLLFVIAACCFYITKQNSTIIFQFKFNQPLQTILDSTKLIENSKHHEAELNEDVTKLSDMDKIKQQNSELLPRNSAFGTDFSNLDWRNNICVGVDEEGCGVKFKNLQTMLRFAPPYHVLACLIQKNMSTVLQAILCFLFDEKEFRKANRNFSQEYLPVTFCSRKNQYNGVGEAEELMDLVHYNMTDWLHLAIVRDPIDRFLSGYVDKCVKEPHSPEDYCNGCKWNMTCFIITEYEKIMNYSFSDLISTSFEDRHFFPQTWRCNFKTEIERYKFVHYSSAPQYAEKFREDLLDILRSQKIPEESLQFIKDQLKGGRTVHSTVTSDFRVFYEERLKSSPFLLEYVIRMFYWDYRIFGFELPNVQNDVARVTP